MGKVQPWAGAPQLLMWTPASPHGCKAGIVPSPPTSSQVLTSPLPANRQSLQLPPKQKGAGVGRKGQQLGSSPGGRREKQGHPVRETLPPCLHSIGSRAPQQACSANTGQSQLCTKLKALAVSIQKRRENRAQVGRSSSFSLTVLLQCPHVFFLKNI